MRDISRRMWCISQGEEGAEAPSLNQMTHGLLYRVKRAARQIGEQHAHRRRTHVIEPLVEQSALADASLALDHDATARTAGGEAV